MILRFDGGPMDGLEEDLPRGSPPHLIFRTPPVSAIVRAMETARYGEQPPDFGATYELVDVDRVAGVAMYEVHGEKRRERAVSSPMRFRGGANLKALSVRARERVRRGGV